MRRKLWMRMLSLLLVATTLFSALPTEIFAQKTEAEELYIKSVKLAQAKTKKDAKSRLEEEGYIFLEDNLNEGTGKDGVWLGYTTTTDPTEAVYDIKLMNMKGGFTLTSMKKAIATQKTVFTQMATDLEFLIKEFVKAYNDNSIPAKKAYKALNFFRMVDGEATLKEKNGLGYQIVNGEITISTLTEIIMLCDSGIVDSIIKILTMGIQVRNENWMKQLSQKGPYNEDTVYGEDEEELTRRAEQLLMVLQLYSQTFNAMELSGLIPDKLDENFEPVNSTQKKVENLDAEDAAVKKLDESRYKIYKIVFDELAEYTYGTGGYTLKDFFCSLENESDARKLFPLVSVLSDGEFASLSYGCFLEIATGASATSDDFESYDEVFDEVTKEVKSVYLYAGVDKVLLDEDTVIGFTEAANRHMASTGELEFYEKESYAEDAWETGKTVATIVGSTGMAVMGLAKISIGVTMLVGLASTTAATSIESGFLAGLIKFCSAVGGPYAFLITVALVATVALISFLVSVISEEINGSIDWDENPMPEFLYDVKEVVFYQNSVNDGVATEHVRRPVFAFYEAVTDINGKVVDLNARSKDASQWIAMYVSYDKQGDNAKPIRAEEILVQKGNGDAPEGYVPLSSFGEVIAYNLNQWDENDDVNGVYMFYKQDQNAVVDSGMTYYIYDVYLQTGESDAHCISLLEAAGYTPLNVNLTPSLTDDDIVFRDRIYTYLGYKVTTNPNSAIRDIRIGYGASKGEIKYGSVTYADCGSNGLITLYATKYKGAGTPVLAGGLICVNNRSEAPAGYEPVCLMSGGPAVTFNTTSDGIKPDSDDYFIYFLPETTFTSGISYLGGISFMNIDTYGMYQVMRPFGYSNEIYKYLKKMTGETYSKNNPDKAVNDYMFIRLGYQHSVVKDNYKETVLYSATYNPYRAVYGIKATGMRGAPSSAIFESMGYIPWSIFAFDSYQKYISANVDFAIGCDDVGPGAIMQGKLYLTGNPASSNVYNEKTGAMSKTQPLKMSDFICLENGDDSSAVSGSDSAYKPVTDMYSSSKDAVSIHLYLKYAESSSSEHKKEFKFYTVQATEERPYVSNVTAIDELSIYRASGGAAAGASFDSVTDAMMLSQLAIQGATNFNSHRVSLKQTDVWDAGLLWDSYDELNAIRFGYMRSSKATDALRDMFLYFGGFSTDEPPKELYRGKVKYLLLCEIPYNLTGYDSAPGPGIYLYGTTDKRAGDRIIDFEISGTPFMDGYETVRTMNGRSLFGEISDYVAEQNQSHPMKWAKKMYDNLKSFFDNDDGKQQNSYFYLHFKREGDHIRVQKPYIEKLYLASCDEDKPTAMDRLFDLGAQGYINTDLNKGAGGDYVYLGYSYTADKTNAIKDILAYHKKNPPKTLNSGGFEYTLVQNLDLNKDAGGDYIYLYTTKKNSDSAPIYSLDVAFEKRKTGEIKTAALADGTEATVSTFYTKRWDSGKYSELNDGAGGKYIYLFYTKVYDGENGSYEELNYGTDKTYNRNKIKNTNSDGQYIAALYVMDKNTIRQEKLAAGMASGDCTCDKITDQEVFDRLKKMGATTIIETPVKVDSDSYFKNNKNKVFIGYSRTDNVRAAIKNIALKAEILSLAEPKEKIEIDRKSYNLVAEAASNVTELPRAINLLGTEDGQDLLLPRLYLYYSTSGSADPIYDICIDDKPIKNGWHTVRSANSIDPFADIYYQSYEQYELANQDDWDNYDSEIVYTDSLFEWMKDISDLFDPEDAEAKPFFIHCKKHPGSLLEESCPYIGEIFVAKGDSKHEALSKLIAFDPDGYIDCDLNRDAGGNYVYLAYSRVASEKDALTDLAVFEGKNPEPGRRIIVSGVSVRYTLVSDVDLNSEAGGKYLYLYSTSSGNSGNPITSLYIKEKIESSLKCGVEKVTVKRASGSKFSNDYIDLNKGAGGDYLYMIMQRETTGGHKMGEVVDKSGKAPTCVDEGYDITVGKCAQCGALTEETTVVPATGDHVDIGNDGDHKCDVCGKEGVTTHTYGEIRQELIKEATCTEKGSYRSVFYCVECGEKLREAIVETGIDPENHTIGEPVEEDRTEPTEVKDGSYKKVIYCSRCNEKLSEEIVVIPATGQIESEEGKPEEDNSEAGKPEEDNSEAGKPEEENSEEEQQGLVGSLFGDGSVIVICLLVSFAALVAIIVFLQKRKKEVQ